MARPKRLHLILGDQLFPLPLLKSEAFDLVFMSEDEELCTVTRHHKIKLVQFLSSMRVYRDQLKQAGIKVRYREIERGFHTVQGAYEKRLEAALTQEKIDELVVWEIEDHFFAQRIDALARRLDIKMVVRDSPMFLTSRAEFKSYLKRVKKPFMKTFYEAQRRRLGLLIMKDGTPVGDRWSFDEENRQKYPAEIEVPNLPTTDSIWSAAEKKHIKAVSSLVEDCFPSHPGSSSDMWLPVSHQGATEWLDRFLAERLASFGPYEDALHPSITFGFHSVLSPLLNCGLLTPDEVVGRLMKSFKSRRPPLASVEGFLRQVIGWREFVRGIYHEFDERQTKANFWNHERRLAPCWWTGETGILPVDHAIAKATRWGWTHHIERLMLLSNTMLLCRVLPSEAHRWFMEFHVDSAEWVMGPNVYGMGQFSDGGLFATKPYICGSNYILKMSPYKKAPWCEEMDALYWTFIADHRDFYARNPRMAVMVKALEKMPKARRSALEKQARETIERLTLSPR